MKIKFVPTLIAAYSAALLLVSWWPYHFVIHTKPRSAMEWPLFSQLSPEYWGDGKSYVLKIVTFVPLGVLLAVAADVPVRLIRVAGQALAAGFALNLAIQIGWFFLPHRSVGGTELILGCIGTLVGISPLCFRYLWRRALWFLTGLYSLAFLVAATWPWQFKAMSPTQIWHRIEWIPFNGRLFAMWVLKEGALNSLMTVPLGLLAASYVLHGGGRGRSAAGVAALLGFSCSFTVEVMQIFLPTRTPSTSDVMLNTIGAVAGAAVAYYLDRWHHHEHPDKSPSVSIRDRN